VSQSADRAVDSRLAGPRWKGFYIIAGVAALIAVVFFRRNFGVELIGFRGFDILDVAATHPGSAFDWCRLLQDDALAGLALLNMYAALRQWRTLIQERGNSERRKADFCGIICIGRSTLMNSTRIGVMRLFLLSGQPYSEEANMDQARVRFEQYLKRRFGQSSTLKHYISDLIIFIDAVDN
jgi:hypothetical protein